MTHTDSPYIRALGNNSNINININYKIRNCTVFDNIHSFCTGFMYIRYTQPPGDLYDWYEEYLQDEEEVDVKAGGGQVRYTQIAFFLNFISNISNISFINISFQVVTIGHMLYQWLTKLDWFSTLFPRIPVPIQKQIERKLNDYSREYNINFAGRNDVTETVPATRPNANREYSERSGTSYQNSNRQRSTSQSRDKYRERDQERDRPKERDRDRERRDYRLGRNERRDEYVEQRSHKRSRSRSREKTHSKRYDQRDSKDSGHRSRERDSKGSHGYKVNDRDHYDNHRSYSRDRDRDSRYH